MKIFIMGSSGQIGHHLHTYLHHFLPNADVVGSSRSFRLSAHQTSDQLQIIRFDPFEDSWSQLGKADILINAIGQIRESKESRFETVHIGLIRHFLAHRESLGNPLFIQISALGAGEHKDLSFLETKAQADQLLLEQHPNSIVLRPSIVCSQESMLAQRLKTLLQIAKASMSRLIVPKGFLASKTQPLLVQDLCEVVGNICLGKVAPGKTYELAGPKALRFRQLLTAGAKAQGMKLRFIEVPRPVIEPSVRYFVAPMMPGILTYEQFQLLFQDNISASGDLGKILGREPASTLPFWEEELKK